MKVAPFLGLALLSLSSAAHAVNLQCDIGPISKTFGGALWLVYACNDGRSLALITPKESKAFPFEFNLYSSAAGQPYQIHGEGTGSRTVTDAAIAELKALKQSDIDHLLSEAVGQGKH